jgi:hypothetical protein
LSKKVLVGDAEPDSTWYLSPDELAGLDIDFQPGVRVADIDRSGRWFVCERPCGGCPLMEPTTLGDASEALIDKLLLDAQDRISGHAEALLRFIEGKVDVAVVGAVELAAQLDVVLDRRP